MNPKEKKPVQCVSPIGERPPAWQIGNCEKEAYGSPSGRLMKQTRGKCPHILALANTRTALRAWREDSGGITKLLLAAIADPLAQQDARMSDTIALYIRILLATQNLHSKR